MEAEDPTNSPKALRVRRLLTMIPERAYTATVGRFARMPVPVWARRHAYGAYGRLVGADLREAALDVRDFDSFDAMFTRELATGRRPICSGPEPCCPADGRVAAVGAVARGKLLQAKGIAYSLESLVGEAPPATSLRFATVYLSPADYHRVHAPFDFSVRVVRHLGGSLFPVNGLSVPYVPSLFATNERLALVGHRSDGSWCAVVLVAALGVGWMTLMKGPSVSRAHVESQRVEWDCHGRLRFGRGEQLGMFHLGSTVVVIDAGDPGSATVGACRVGEMLYSSR